MAGPSSTLCASSHVGVLHEERYRPVFRGAKKLLYEVDEMDRVVPLSVCLSCQDDEVGYNFVFKLVKRWRGRLTMQDIYELASPDGKRLRLCHANEHGWQAEWLGQ